MYYTDEMKRRLKRLEGQVRGVLRMMEEEKDCKEVVNQLSAVRNAADKAIALVVATNLEQCIKEEQAAGRETGSFVQQAVDLLVKSR
ncbi:metal-sensitive transcriptional regulator [Ammoniphilus sp. CFH 90114]|uniref:metal-sensitive transcriptional regulator n=1 Tax=Ammoniphilus sp. CFH 90114 TaxID=2493665 RepID=UPI00100DDA73|nr:metal-sensitive transcriptional regulator [Ammoniphilus sp. CFH 90114]RXT07920.1 metal-sensitive transcriptional regulator [Ammoniphilus sp. CFH 90114]